MGIIDILSKQNNPKQKQNLRDFEPNKRSHLINDYG